MAPEVIPSMATSGLFSCGVSTTSQALKRAVDAVGRRLYVVLSLGQDAVPQVHRELRKPSNADSSQAMETAAKQCRQQPSNADSNVIAVPLDSVWIPTTHYSPRHWSVH